MKPSKILAKLVKDVYNQKMQTGEDFTIHLMGHSEGGMQLSHGIGGLDPGQKEKLHVTTYGSAKVILNDGYKHCKNYYSRNDFARHFDRAGIKRGLITADVEFLEPKVRGSDHGFMQETYRDHRQHWANDYVSNRR